MAGVSAAMVKSLRERSGLPMMDCKQALTEANGDEEAAMDLLRKRGAAAAAKKADRATSEGRIGAFVDRARGVGALVELLCETAPVANNPEFKALAGRIAKAAAVGGCADPDRLLAEKCADEPGMTVRDAIHDTLNRLRENIRLGQIVRETGHIATYVHHTGKLGVLLVVEGQTDNAELLNDVCMHIAAMHPEAVRREEMSPDVVAKEEEIAREQIRASGKPENLVDKILAGKMAKYFAETVLIEQAFVKDDKKTVGQVLKAAGIQVRKFARLTVGG